ncbi:hypothetical protein FPRO06_11835 [Fusarium proliferatum]|nr:hypothetical protein FPRO06_11835 [Fusarium proliferatum]
MTADAGKWATKLSQPSSIELSHNTYDGSLSSTMKDDSNIPLRNIIDSHGKSIASLLQDIGEKQLPQQKFLSFIKDLECLTFGENTCDGPRLMRHNINAFKQREYVALSYTWDNSDQEDPRNGKYKVQNRDRLQFFPSPVRDCVFDRVNSFMHAKGLRRLWIDRHCVKQKTCRKKDVCTHKRCNEKKRAVETMDLVYSLSEHPVALLGKPIEWAYELDLLAKVLGETFVKEPKQVDHDEILQALSLLTRITKDRWWTRAWTFQENYRGLRNMTLLIRHPDFLEARKQAHKCFSDVPNELCIGSEQFCRTTTKLCCWAAQEFQQDDISHHTKKILRVAGKYTALLDKSMPMTPRVIADIQTRGLKDAWDRLAIIANCCQYAIRMDQARMQEPKSLSISILAMCLLNGEILSHQSREHSFSILEKPLSQFLEDQAFNDFYAPEGERWFTFNKRCRFFDVELKPNGVKTKGHLWQLDRIIDTASFRLLLPESIEKTSFSAKDEKRLISQLAGELRRLHEITLALHLERFLNCGQTSQGQALQRETFPERYMRLMAKELVLAMSKGKLLRLGRVWNAQKRKTACSAIFIWDADGTQKPDDKDQFDRSKINSKRKGRSDWDFAFTASRPLERGSQNHGTNDLDHHVSLELKELRIQGAQVNLYQAGMPPICGTANAALLLSDRTFTELKVNDFTKVFGPKVKGTHNLHELLIDQKLDFFIMFSSFASVVGNRGQANYAASNLFMSAIAEQRRVKGLAASVMHIGMVLGVGYVSSTGAYEATLRSSNYMAISETDLLNMFSQAILVGQPTSTHAPELITGLNRFSLEPEAQKYFWRDNMRFCHHTLEEEHQERASATKVSISHRLSEAKGPSEILAVVEEEFCTKLERLLQAEAGSVKTSQSLLGLGVDSLVAAEIRSWFLKELEVDTPVLEILNTASITELCSTVVSHLPTISGEIEPKTEVTKQAIKTLNVVETSTAVSSALPTENESFTIRNSPNSTQVTSEAGVDEDTSIQSKIDRTGPLSFAQERLWFLQQFLRDHSTYNVTMHYHISGPLRLYDLERAFQQVIHRHESLRTSFFIDPDTDLPTQAVLKDFRFKQEQKHNSTAKIEYKAMQEMSYDLENGSVTKAVIVPDSDGEFDLIFGFHHIALDGYSAQIMVRDLAMAYAGQTLSSKQQDYVDFAIAQKAAKVPETTLAYWRSELEELPPALSVFDFAETKTRIPLTDYTTRALERTLSIDQSRSIKAIAKCLDVTPFHIHLAALQVVLSDLASAKDLCIGITDANKNDATHIDTVGFFVNLLPLRLKLSPSQTLAEVVANAKSKANSALSHSDIPFDVLLDEMKLPRSTTHSPLFQVILNYKMGSTQKVPLADCQAQLVAFKDANNPYDLTFDIETYQDGSASISVKTQEYLYSENLFASEPSRTVEQICKPTAEQIDKALTLGRGEKIPSPRLETLYHYFEECVVKQPDDTALVTDKGQALTWCQLKALVNQIAMTLVEAGAKQESRVCVYCEPSMYILPTLMAIAEVGGVYVPLDAQNPIKRLQLMVDDCQPDVLLIDDSTATSHGLDTNARVINVNTTKADPPNTFHLDNRARGDGMGYIFYTSGTTGVPKAVSLTQASLVHHFDGFIHYNNLNKCRMLQQAPLGFDMSLTQMTLAIMLRGTLIVTTSETRKDPMQLAQLMLDEEITHTFMTPTLALSLIHHGYEYLRQCVDWEHASLVMEAMTIRVTREFKRLGLRNLELLNGYGPTEITIIATCGSNELGDTLHDTHNPSIGRALPNYSCYILDENMQPVRPGLAGELVIGGAGVAIGYLNKQDLTEAKFLPDPFSPPEDVARGWTRMYRTGDKARFLSDGRLCFLGRIAGDSQTKLRGFRIELEDIASTVVRASDGKIPEAAVSLRGEGDSAYLIAFVILSQFNCPSDEKVYLKQLLKDLSLPRYMKPARIVSIDQLPMSASDKLDQYALDALRVPHEEDVVDKPLTETQERLKLGWLKALPFNDAPIGPDTEFFSAGGNSLRIVSLREYITREFGVTVSVFDLFQASTLGEMAAKIDGSTTQGRTTMSIDWDEETRIDADLSIVGAQEPLPSETTNDLQVALTGATGFLGVSILKALLEDKRVSKVHCLAVRSSSNTSDPVFSSSRVACYPGDLSLPPLGLSQEQFDQLAETVGRIIHNGADVSFLKTYQSLKRSNVSSSRELARMAIQRRIPVHFVSTGGVVQLSGQDGLDEVSVADSVPPTDGSLGYVASKWASEVILEKYATQYNLPVWIHRPSNITGPDAPKADLMQNIFHYSIKIFSLPDLSSWSGCFDFVPVDVVAAGIASSIYETQDTVAYKHHCGTEKISVEDLSSYLEKEHGKIGTVGVEEWLERSKAAGLDEVTAALVQKTLSGGGIVPWLRKEAH